MGTVSGSTGPPVRNSSDYDKNGADDLALVTDEPGGGIAVSVGRSTHAGFWMQTWWQDPYTRWASVTPLSGDVSGDGAADYVYLLPTGTRAQAWVAKSNAGSYQPAQLWWSAQGWDFNVIKANLGDINGDGAADLVLTYKEPNGTLSVHVGLSTQAGFWMNLWWYDPYTSWDAMAPLVGDVTGDKVADYTFNSAHSGRSPSVGHQIN